jgi:hypothetical protein
MTSCGVDSQGTVVSYSQVYYNAIIVFLWDFAFKTKRLMDKWELMEKAWRRVFKPFAEIMQ